MVGRWGMSDVVGPIAVIPRDGAGPLLPGVAEVSPDTQKLVDRLTEVRQIVDALPEAGRKPIYVAEYGVRGLRSFNGVPTVDPGVWQDGTPITQTNISAFQHAWFDVLAADPPARAAVGVAGLPKGVQVEVDAIVALPD